jgi:hypothetical protein
VHGLVTVVATAVLVAVKVPDVQLVMAAAIALDLHTTTA